MLVLTCYIIISLFSMKSVDWLQNYSFLCCVGWRTSTQFIVQVSCSCEVIVVWQSLRRAIDRLVSAYVRCHTNAMICGERVTVLLTAWMATMRLHASFHFVSIFLARDVIYTSRAYATMSVSVYLSVTEANWRIIANLGFKFRSKFTAHCRHGEGSSQQQHLALC